MSIRIAALLLSLGAPVFGQEGQATYRVTFQSTWSAQTHPTSFPSSPSFSGFAGAAHTLGSTLWAPGQLATFGLQQLAETGNPQAFLQQAQATIGSQLVGSIGTSTSPATTVFQFTTHQPLLSIAAKLDPSPDWFVGLTDALLPGPFGPGVVVLPAEVYDAGTDSGVSYSSPNSPTVPAAPVQVVSTAGGPFQNAPTQIGTFTIERLSGYEVFGCTNPLDSIAVGGTPSVEQTLDFALDDPTGSMPLPALSGFGLSTTAQPTYPCGVQLPGFHLQQGLDGEVVLGSIDVLVAGPVYSGAPVLVPVPIPNQPVLVGFDFVVQGLLASTRVGLTRGVAVRVGS